MKSLFFLFTLVLFIAKDASSATRLDFRTVDELTYRFYTEQKWDSVIMIGKKALKQDIDYYYLRVRIGIAYYNKHQYFSASDHLRKAYDLNSSDPFTMEYLYNSYISTNRQSDAELLVSKMPDDLKKNFLVKNKILQQVTIEGGPTFSSDDHNKEKPDLMGQDSIYGSQELYGNSYYGNLNFTLHLSPRINVTLAYSYLNFNKHAYFQYGWYEDQLDSVTNYSWGTVNHYSFPRKVNNADYSFHVNQHQLYIGGVILIPGEFKVIPAFQLINVRSPKISSMYTPRAISDTIVKDTITPSTVIYSFSQANYTFTQTDSSFYNYLFSLMITKEFSIFISGLSASYSNLNGLRQTQLGWSLTYFPLNNINFYGTSVITGFFQGKENRVLLSQVVGGKITPWMWLEGNFYWGDYSNANIYNGFVVYNNSDIIDYRAGANLVFIMGKHLQLSLIYQYFRKESQQLYYIKTTNPVTNEINETAQIKNNPYNINTIIGGITWKLY